MVSLTVLDISFNDFSGVMPEQLPPNLKILNIGHCNLTGEVS